MSESWDSASWLREAKSLLRWIKEREDSPTMLMIRHSERLEDLDVMGTVKAELTDGGHALAIDFGKRLPREKNAIVFHSPHIRTTQTAERIIEGLKGVGGNALLGGKVRVLLGAPGNVERFVAIAEEIGFDEFYHRWANGSMDEETIMPLDEYLESLIPETFMRLAKARSNILQIHVTHDIVVAAARRAFLELDSDSGLAVPFLSGFAITKTANGYRGYTQGHEARVRNNLLPRAREE